MMVALYAELIESPKLVEFPRPTVKNFFWKP